MRAAACLLALAAALGLALQFAHDAARLGLPGALWLMAGFFTVATNALLCAVMARAALSGRAGAGSQGLVLVQILVVGLVYHLLLASQYHPEGLAWWADLLLHTATPLGAAGFWWRFAPKAGLAGRDALLWLLWPLGFCLYALGRGLATGWYPYFFLDPAVMSWPGVGAAVVGLAALFWGLGRATVALARRLTPGSACSPGTSAAPGRSPARGG